jgi:hypothetical protein
MIAAAIFGSCLDVLFLGWNMPPNFSLDEKEIFS